MGKQNPTDKPAMKHYGDLLTDIKVRIRQAQNRAIMAANTELVHLYWDIGRMVAAKQAAEGWGTAVIARLPWAHNVILIQKNKGTDHTLIGMLDRLWKRAGAVTPLQYGV